MGSVLSNEQLASLAAKYKDGCQTDLEERIRMLQTNEDMRNGIASVYLRLALKRFLFTHQTPVGSQQRRDEATAFIYNIGMFLEYYTALDECEKALFWRSMQNLRERWAPRRSTALTPSEWHPHRLQNQNQNQNPVTLALPAWATYTDGGTTILGQADGTVSTRLGAVASDNRFPVDDGVVTIGPAGPV